MGCCMGIVLIIIGLIMIVFGKVLHITDSTIKAAGWIILNWILRVVGIIFVLFGVGNILGI